MMKTLKISVFLIFISLFSNCNIGFAQPITAKPETIDSLLQLLPSLPKDTNRVRNLLLLAQMLTNKNIDQALKYANEGYMLAQKLDFKKGEIGCMLDIAYISALTGEWVKGWIYLTKVSIYVKNINHLGYLDSIQ